MEYNVFQNNELLDIVKDKVNWNLYKLTDILVDDTKNATKIKKESYLDKGKYPIIDQGQSVIAGYTNQNKDLYTEYPFLIFGDHTRIIKYVDFSIFMGADGVKLLKPLLSGNQLNVKYIYYFLNTVQLPSDGYSRHFKYLKEIVIPVPKIEIQDKIVEVLDKAQELIDKRKAQIKVLDELVKSRFIEMFGSPVSNPKSWPIYMLKEVCTKVTDGTHFSPENFSEGQYKYITAKNIKVKGFDFSNLTYVNEEIHKEIYSRCNVEKGDVLYIKDGATTGIAMVNNLEEEFSLLSSVALLKQNRSVINGIYLCNSLNNGQMYNQIRNNMGGAAITRLTIAKLNVIKIPVPPIDLQNQFSDFVKKVDKLKFEMQESLKQLEDNFNVLMQKAFNGELFKY